MGVGIILQILAEEFIVSAFQPLAYTTKIVVLQCCYELMRYVIQDHGNFLPKLLIT